MSRILFISNIPTPYQIDFFNEVAKSADLRCIFLANKEDNRDWTLDLPSWATILDPADGWEAVTKLIRDFKPTSMVVGGYSLQYSLRLLAYSRLNGIRCAYWLEPPLPAGNLKAFIKKGYFSLVLPRADVVIAIGKNAVKSYSPYAKSIVNIPYSINEQRYSRRAPHSDPIKFLYLGQYIDRKGIRPLLKAVEQLPNDSYQLDLVGSGELKDLVVDYSRRFKEVNQRDFVNPPEVPKLISEYDVLVAPSFHDGWAVVIAEALVSGLPVISTPYAGAAVDLINSTGDMKNGLVIEPTASTLADALNGYIDGRYDLELESENAVQSCSSSLAVANNAARVFTDVLGNKKV